MIKSPLRYPGGKSRAIDYISTLIPRDFEEYREPFLGGGSVYIHLKQKYPHRRFWINDLYFELYNFWKMSQEDISLVINQILLWKNKFSDGKMLYHFLKQNLYRFDKIESAGTFFILNRITFSGTTDAGGFSENSFEHRFTDTSVERLREIGNILKNTKITNLDYQKLVEAEGENVFIFLDPPYYSATDSRLYGKSGSRNIHANFDHLRFVDTLKKCKHKWLVTYDDSPFIRKSFYFANIISWNLTYGMRNVTKNSVNNSQIGEELFISNMNLNDIKNENKKQLSIDDAWGNIQIT